MKVVLYLRGCIKSCYYFLHLLSDLIKFSTEHVHSNLLSDCGFCESRFNETHVLLEGVNEFPFVLSTCVA